jgi:ribosomal protein S18 acetylase RimI-like enzyme
MAEISVAGSDRLDELRALWLELHHHHQRVARVPPTADDRTSWTVRRAGYVGILEAGGVLLVAEDGEGLAGYALLKFHDGPDDSWDLGNRYAEVWTLVVAERARGRGIGSALLDAIDEQLAQRGIRGLTIGAMAGNDDAIRLYERRGLVPGWIGLYRLAGG